ncbi:ferrochelatase [Pelistega europaea]|uniref:Ferrochelatase n=1 Tax=Pelistega europaea TaxID=106147 RepID=A0A7Y4P651_9BURK|nr:ferrochelatase [Pelistega europaea]NOL49559.1 ferrochelatase [Pelistega europaea]
MSNPIGVLLVNLGTPASYEVADIRRYLNEFLSDPRVVELPKPLWQVILKCMVLPFRAPKLVEKYRAIWLKEGSPLLVYTRAQADGLAERLAANNVIVDMAMRYGEPDLEQKIIGLQHQGCERMLIVPMYPQYAASTTATLFDRVAQISRKMRNQPDYRFIKRYAEHPAYISCLQHKVERFWQDYGKPERLLLSFHGLPQRSVDLGDPYYDDCQKTAALLREVLREHGVPIEVSFQSQFGRAKWVGPATLKVLEAYPAQGVTRVDVMCPGFAADCLETLEEIRLGCASAFKTKGGQQFRYIPCLNDDGEWIEALAEIVKSRLESWD